MSDDYGLLNPAAEQNLPIQRVKEGALAFERLPDGSVEVRWPDNSSRTSNETIGQTIPPEHWASLVLTMTKFNERPNDWHRWMEHHQGTLDILSLSHPWNQK